MQKIDKNIEFEGQTFSLTIDFVIGSGSGRYLSICPRGDNASLVFHPLKDNSSFEDLSLDLIKQKCIEACKKLKLRTAVLNEINQWDGNI